MWWLLGSGDLPGGERMPSLPQALALGSSQLCLEKSEQMEVSINTQNRKWRRKKRGRRRSLADAMVEGTGREFHWSELFKDEGPCHAFPYYWVFGTALMCSRLPLGFVGWGIPSIVPNQAQVWHLPSKHSTHYIVSLVPMCFLLRSEFVLYFQVKINQEKLLLNPDTGHILGWLN